LGQELRLSGAGAARLLDGAAQLKLDVASLGDAPATLSIALNYANGTGLSQLDVKLAEAAGGSLSRIIGLPGAPSFRLEANAKPAKGGLLGQFELNTAGVPRLRGELTLTSKGPEPRRLQASLNGDPGPLLSEAYRPILGDKLSLSLEGSQTSDGWIVDGFSLDARSLQALGDFALDADGALARLAADVSLSGPTTDAPLWLAADTTLASGSGTLRFDRATGEELTFEAELLDLQTPKAGLAKARLSGHGRLPRSGTITAELALVGEELALASDPAAALIGATPHIRTMIAYNPTEGLTFDDLTLEGAALGATASGRLTPGGGTAVLDARGAITLASLDAFVPVKGRARTGFELTADLLGGGFDLLVDGRAEQLVTGVADIDQLLATGATLRARAARDEDGIMLEGLTLGNARVSLVGNGLLAPNGSRLDLKLTMPSLAGLPLLTGGELTLDAALHQADPTAPWHFTANGHGSGLRSGRAELQSLLGTEARLTASASLDDGVFKLEPAELETEAVTLAARGNLTPRLSLEVDASLDDFARTIAEIHGPISAVGILTERDAGGLSLTAQAEGPGGATLVAEGALTGSDAPKLALRGTAPLSLANAFISPQSASGTARLNVTLSDVIGLAGLRGTLEMSGAEILLPTLAQRVSLPLATLGLTGDDPARVEVTGTLGEGNFRATGSISFAPPNPFSLAVALNQLGLDYPDLLTTRLGGALRVSGAFQEGVEISGGVTLAATEITVPKAFGGVEPIPDITHLGAATPIRKTQARAGLLKAPSPRDSNSKRASELDIDVRAVEPVFVRGRGLEAEMAGAFQITGTTTAPEPVGALQLTRGRLDFLTRPLTLTEGQVDFSGDLEPRLGFAATTDADGLLVIVALEGPASAPQLSATSSPELPESEVLSQLLFGENVSNLSAFQAARLVAAVNTLSGNRNLGLLEELRRGAELDSLSVSQSAAGDTSVAAGAYITDNVYSEVEIGQASGSSVTLNIDLTPEVRAVGRTGFDADSGIGVFFERDY
ncbi:MAG: translocation/assembly module TamB domain-containing protein, partial [Pseudomonadota bacterium]